MEARAEDSGGGDSRGIFAIDRGPGLFTIPALPNQQPASLSPMKTTALALLLLLALPVSAALGAAMGGAYTVNGITRYPPDLRTVGTNVFDVGLIRAWEHNQKARRAVGPRPFPQWQSITGSLIRREGKGIFIDQVISTGKIRVVFVLGMPVGANRYLEDFATQIGTIPFEGKLVPYFDTGRHPPKLTVEKSSHP